MQKNKIIRQALPLVPAMLLAGCAGLSQSPAHLEPAFWKGEPPDALVSRNGRKIDSAAAWMEIRRPELLHLFSTTVYGKPLPVPEGIEFRVLERDDNALGGKAIRIQGDILCKGIDQPNPFRLLLYLPKNAGGPVPVFLGLNFQGNHSTTFDPAVLIPEWNPKPRPRGNRADRYDADQQRVVVAVFDDAFDVQKVTAGFAFRPQTVFRAAEKGHATFGHGFVVGFLIHVAQHQDLARIVVLDDCGNQSLTTLGCVQFTEFYHNLTGICSLFNSCFRRGIGISP